MSLASLKHELGSRLITSGSDAYELSRRVFNGDIDKRPAAIAMCRSRDEIARCLEAANTGGVKVAIRSSGHNVAGRSVVSGGLVIDLTMMKGVLVDGTSEMATARPGTNWGEFDNATQAFGLATTGGTVTSTALPGLTLGGGVGWLLPSCGLTCDNLVGVRALSTAGDFFRISETENAELLWAMRGGGLGLGVVLELDYRLHRIGDLIGGAYQYRMGVAPAVLETLADLFNTLPREVMISPSLIWKGDSPLLEVVIAVNSKGRAARVASYLAERHSPEVNLVREISYCEMQRFLDNPSRFGMRAYWKSGFLDRIDRETIEVLVRSFRESPSTQCMIILEHYHGRYAEPHTLSAFPHRSETFNVLVIGAWTEEDHLRGASSRVRMWARETLASLSARLTGTAYINYGAPESEHRPVVECEASSARLKRARDRLDPVQCLAT